MGIEKQGENYVGGFFQLFDWKAKSRKKLFSGKSDTPKQSKQKKRNDRNLPSTRCQIFDEDEIAAGSSLRGSSDYSCASSSINDDDFYGTKAPNVVARLMGLDSLPKSIEPYSSPFCDAQSVSDAYFRTKHLEYCQDPQIMHSGSLSVQSDTKPKNLRPIKKFETETLPPKSAKSIPITHNKLLSPIKSVNSIPAKDAAIIMEAAARIIERGPQTSAKAKLTPVSSSSNLLKVRDLKENVNTAQKRSTVNGVSHRSGESSAVKHGKGHSANKIRNGAMDSTSMSVYSDSEAKNKGKSMSLALQAKANVQKRRINGSGKMMVIEKEASDYNEYQLSKSRSTTQNSTVKKVNRENGSSVLRQNNQKQNCIADGGKETSKNHFKKGKAVNDDSSSARQRNSSKASGTSRISSKKSSSNFKDNKMEMSSRSEVVTRKRSIDGTYHFEKNRVENNDKRFQSCKSSWEQDTGSKGADVVSFTFNAPLTRSGLGSGRHFKNGESYTTFPDDSRSKRTLLSSDGITAARFSYPEHNMKGSDSFSALLEQKLKELNDLVELAQHKTGPDGINAEDKHSKNDMVSSSIFQARKLIDSRLPSLVSVLDYSSLAESCNSTKTAHSFGTGSQHCSSTQAREVLPNSLNTFLPTEEYVELSDSASSISAQSIANQRRWELEYVREILFNVELMFENYALGKTSEIIDARLFDQMESRKVYFGQSEDVSGTKQRRLLFDSVSEILDMRCRKYGYGGYSLWAKGELAVKRTERLAEELYKEIMVCSGLGDSMVDEIVDKDMSCQYGRWLDFDIEAFETGVQIESRILNSLIDEVVDNLLF